MIRVLQVVSMLFSGGVENYIMNIYRRIDRSVMQFDFLVHHGSVEHFEPEIERLGGHIYHTTVMDDKNFPKYFKELEAIFSSGQYTIVHGHMDSFAYLYLGVAKRCGVPVRIVHSHESDYVHNAKGYLRMLCYRLAPVHANVYMACSQSAGEYLFPGRTFEVAHNGIDTARFRFSEAMREQKRRELGLADAFVVGHVGRLSKVKNHAFLIRAFARLRERLPNARLLLLGEGEEQEAVDALIASLDLAPYVCRAGVQSRSEDYYQAMDVFVLPSLYEGLPLSGIEAQYNGLHCLFSDRVPREVTISQRCAFLPIGKEDEERWADALLAVQREAAPRTDADIEGNAYDINQSARQMMARYLELERERA